MESGAPEDRVGGPESIVLSFDRRGATTPGRLRSPAGGEGGLDVEVTPVLEGGALVGVRMTFDERTERAGEGGLERVLIELRTTLDELETTNHELQATVSELEVRVQELGSENRELRQRNDDLRRQRDDDVV